jgi:hypothetical protein
MESSMSTENLTLPFVITPAAVEAVVRQAQDARAETIRFWLLALPSTIKNRVRQYFDLDRAPRFGFRA